MLQDENPGVGILVSRERQGLSLKVLGLGSWKATHCPLLDMREQYSTSCTVYTLSVSFLALVGDHPEHQQTVLLANRPSRELALLWVKLAGRGLVMQTICVALVKLT